MTRALDMPLGELAPLLQQLGQLHQRAVQVYAPEVDAMVRANSRDMQSIECTLDGLLSFCSAADALILFKSLCRHYWGIDQAATAFYIDSYRQMWDSEAPEDAA